MAQVGQAVSNQFQKLTHEITEARPGLILRLELEAADALQIVWPDHARDLGGEGGVAVREEDVRAVKDVGSFVVDLLAGAKEGEGA